MGMQLVRSERAVVDAARPLVAAGLPAGRTAGTVSGAVVNVCGKKLLGEMMYGYEGDERLVGRGGRRSVVEAHGSSAFRGIRVDWLA